LLTFTLEQTYHLHHLET